MALLRNSARVWMRSVRLFSAEPQFTTPRTYQPVKSNKRAVQNMLLQQCDFAINKYLVGQEFTSEPNWTDVRKELVSSTLHKITEATVDMVIVNLCVDNHKSNLAMLYLQYLWDNGYEMNVSSMTTYLKLCYAKKNRGFDETERDYLLKMYNTIREKYSVLDAKTAEYCIMGISMTESWRDSLELLESMKVLDRPCSAAYTAVICAAFEHDVPEIGWKYLQEVLALKNPDHSAYIAYLDYCTRNFKGLELESEIGKMIEFWGERDVRPYVEVIEAYEKIFADLGWTTKYTSIRTLGSCRSCARQLTSLEVTEEQFAKLARRVRERVIVGDDVYRRTTPEELKTFLRFVERTRPYDIVIDGLNVSYVNRSAMKPDGSQLLEVFKLCRTMAKKVLVLGRKHMVKWRNLDINYIQRHGHIFLANDSSEDDPYMLYASLCSGPHTRFVSKDLMRQHKFLLEDKDLVRIFKYWQLAHQLMPCGIVTGRSTQLHLKNAPIYLPVAQKDDNGFHIPYNSDRSLQPPLIYEPPKSWVCFRKTK